MSHLGRRLSPLIDGELSDAERDQALAHLVDCEACRAEAAALRTLKRRVRALGEAPADGALTRRLMALGPVPGSPAGGYPARTARPLGTPAAAGRNRASTRYLVAGAVAALAVGLGAASFAAGGTGQNLPGPAVTPDVDSFNVQHAATFGEMPAFQSPATSVIWQKAGSLRP